MNTPKVTVLMSVYNGRTYLAEAMESVLSQSFGDFEFLIIDDGSREPFHDIVTACNDNRIVLVHQHNMGLTRSLNKGLLMARGDYIARMDADDVSVPGRLQAQVDRLDRDDRLDLVGCFFDVIDGAGTLVERKELFTDPIYRLWRLQFHNNYGHGSIMMRKRSVVEAGMYDETLRYAQDYDLWSRLSRRDNTAMIADVLYRYRMANKSGQSSIRNYDAQLATAIQVSNRSLTACNPRLTEADCREIRALYWEFELDHVSSAGLALVPETLEGFCERYHIRGTEKESLVNRVTREASGEV